MDNQYLLELIEEAQSRDGGLLLNFNNKPAAVVLTIDKYNDLISNTQMPFTNTENLPDPDLFFSNPQTFSPKAKVLVTGGAGYIGSHAARELLKAGYQVVVLDNLSAGKRANVPEGAVFVEGDLADAGLLRDLFAQEQFGAVMHFAASIEVEESVKYPEQYFNNNVVNTARLLAVMAEYGVKNIIFSSTCAVYGQQDSAPINEQAKVGPANPYGYSKLIAERVIKYYCQFSGLRAIVFRYFNAAGCDFDGGIRLTHTSHLISNVLEVAAGAKPFVTVFGQDYGTFDGTCIRDYVHVLDIAKAHLAALEKISQGEAYRIYNIGTGRGNSVLEIINKASEILNKIIPMESGERRAGDPPVLIADNRKLKEELGYTLQYSDLDTIVTTSWQQALKSSE